LGADGDDGTRDAVDRRARDVAVVARSDAQRAPAQGGTARPFGSWRIAMTALAWLIPCALFLGFIGLAAFIWSLNSGQFQDLDGAEWRAISDDEDDGKPKS